MSRGILHKKMNLFEKVFLLSSLEGMGIYKFIQKALLKLNVDFTTLLIVEEGAKTPAGAAGQVRPR